MNPLLVTGLVAIGQKLIDHMFTGPSEPETSASNASGAEFSNYMNSSQAVQRPSELIEFLQNQGVQNGADFHDLQFQLQQQLLNHPELGHYIAGADRAGGFQLNVNEAGVYTLSDSQGKHVIFNEDSPLGQLAGRIQQLGIMESIAKEFPGYGMRDLALKAESITSWAAPVSFGGIR